MANQDRTFYEIYRSVNSTNDYKLFSTTSSTKILDDSLYPNNIYYYKARAYKINNNNKIYGSFSDTKVIDYNIENVKDFKVTPIVNVYGTNKYKLTWNAGKYNDLFVIYRKVSSESDSTYEELTRLYGSSKTSFIDSEALIYDYENENEGIDYTYKIVPYAKRGTTYYQSKYYATKSINPSLIETSSLKDAILENNVVDSKKNNNITTNTTLLHVDLSTEDEGLITGPADESGDTTYYFRGDVKNNSLILPLPNDSQLYFKILRINGDGSVRLILDDRAQSGGVKIKTKYRTVDNYPFEGTNANFDAMKGTLVYEGSDVQTSVNSWYNNTFGEEGSYNTYASYITNSKFCDSSDPTQATEPDNINTQVYDFRGSNNTIQLKCVNENDVYTTKAGLITLDELLYAGADYKSNANTDYFLFNKDDKNSPYDSWTMTSASVNPVTGTVKVFSNAYDWYTYNNNVKSSTNTTEINEELYIRPIISLKSNTPVVYNEDYNAYIVVPS